MTQANPKIRFTDSLQRIREAGSRGYGLYVHLSKLRPYNRQPHHVNSAWSTFEPYLSRVGGDFMFLKNGDIIAVLGNSNQKDIEQFLMRFKRCFSHDPLTVKTMGKEQFYSLYNLGQEGEDFSQLLKNSTPYSFEVIEDSEDLTMGSSKGIPLEFLTELQTILEYADVSNYVRRQPICWIEGDTQPLIVSHEFYLSIGDLRQTLRSTVDFYGNIWLFRQLTLFFDKRVLTYLKKLLNTTKLTSFNINVNVKTILAKSFREFMDGLDPAKYQITVEIDCLDAISDLETFSNAVTVAKNSGCKIGIDGLDRYTLQFFKQNSFDVNGYKLFWKSEMESEPQQTVLRKVMEGISPDALILARCSGPQALQVGQSLGLKLFQGRYIDFLNNRPEQSKSS